MTSSLLAIIKTGLSTSKSPSDVIIFHRSNVTAVFRYYTARELTNNGVYIFVMARVFMFTAKLINIVMCICANRNFTQFMLAELVYLARLNALIRLRVVCPIDRLYRILSSHPVQNYNQVAMIPIEVEIQLERTEKKSSTHIFLCMRGYCEVNLNF